MKLERKIADQEQNIKQRLLVPQPKQKTHTHTSLQNTSTTLNEKPNVVNTKRVSVVIVKMWNDALENSFIDETNQ